MDKETDFFGGVLKIALGLFFGTLLLWIVANHYMRYQVRKLDAVVQTSFQELERQQQRATQQRRQALDEKRALEAAAQEAVLHRQRAAVAADRHKEAAWAAFFQPSAECLAATSVECGNMHIRARREFERRYALGEFGR